MSVEMVSENMIYFPDSTAMNQRFKTEGKVEGDTNTTFTIENESLPDFAPKELAELLENIKRNPLHTLTEQERLLLWEQRVYSSVHPRIYI